MLISLPICLQKSILRVPLQKEQEELEEDEGKGKERTEELKKRPSHPRPLPCDRPSTLDPRPHPPHHRPSSTRSWRRKPHRTVPSDVSWWRRRRSAALSTPA